jgi:hypothetical protein
VLKTISKATHTEDAGIFFSELYELIGVSSDELVFLIENLREHGLVEGTSFTLRDEGITQSFRSEWMYWATQKGRKYLFSSFPRS